MRARLIKRRRACSYRYPTLRFRGAARRGHLMNAVREFIDFWIGNSVHAAEQYRTAGGSQDAGLLTLRLIEAAKGHGISEADLRAEIGDVSAYVKDRLKAVNKAESDRRNPY
jgi:hypothetical protein